MQRRRSLSVGVDEIELQYCPSAFYDCFAEKVAFGGIRMYKPRPRRSRELLRRSGRPVAGLDYFAYQENHRPVGLLLYQDFLQNARRFFREPEYWLMGFDGIDFRQLAFFPKHSHEDGFKLRHKTPCNDEYAVSFRKLHVCSWKTIRPTQPADGSPTSLLIRVPFPEVLRVTQLDTALYELPCVSAEKPDAPLFTLRYDTFGNLFFERGVFWPEALRSRRFDLS